MIKPSDIVLTRRDKLVILYYCLNDMIPWQIPVSVAVLMAFTSCLFINSADWYQNIEHLRHVVRFFVCLPIAFLELCALVAILAPIEDRIMNRWDRFEKKYRENAVKKVDEFLLSQRRNEDSDEA